MYIFSNDPLQFEQANLIAEINDCRASELIKDKKGTTTSVAPDGSMEHRVKNSSVYLERWVR
jgi:hypothetical protein